MNLLRSSLQSKVSKLLKMTLIINPNGFACYLALNGSTKENNGKYLA